MALKNIKNQTASRRRFILVVDSDEASLSGTSSTLDRFQYTICTARTAQEALEIVSVMTPALIIISQKLDDMPGIDLLRTLKQEALTRTVSCIVLTSDKDVAHDRACLAAGAVVCLPSPCQIEDLYRVVQMTIEPVPRMNMRIPTDLQVTIDDRTVEWEQGSCVSVLSEQGAYVVTGQPYPLRTRFPLRIRLAGSAIAVEAEVIYVRRPGAGQEEQPGMGLQFVQISQQDQMRIREFIRDEISGGASVLPQN